MAQTVPAPGSADDYTANKRLFWGCFIALIATAFGFIIRALIINDWGVEFNLSETQKGELLGVGLWPFAISIIVFSLIIDRIGYKNAMIFGLVCHVASAIITIFATGYWMLYIGTFIVALGNGTVEAYINPVVATIFRRDKTKWLNILHAGWPGGLVLGGILTIALGSSVSWEVKVGMILIPTIIYAVMLWNERFPVQERVAAGVSYGAMLREVGIIGAFICSALIMAEVGRVFDFPGWLTIAVIILLTGIYGYYARSLGRAMFILFLIIMIPLAITELGTDSWITELVAPAFQAFGINPGWLLVYTSAIMATLRFFAGPIVHRISPLGLLALSAAIATVGLFLLSNAAAGLVILLAGTIYAVGKTFFWPTTLGVVAEQFPRGGALTLNAVAGVGMLAAGIIGGPVIGYLQDTEVNERLMEDAPAIHDQYVTLEKESVFGDYEALDNDALAAAPPADQQVVVAAQDQAKKDALATIALFPIFMLICYLGLIFYFKSKGGYRPVHLEDEAEEAGTGLPAATEK